MGIKRKPPADNVRRVRSNGQNLCGVITNKANRTVQFESFAERSLLLRLDRDPNVQDYVSQPEQLVYRDSLGKSHTYIPDFKVWNTNEQISIHEVTITYRLDQPNLQQRHAAADRICQERGWKFLIHTEDTLPQGSELANLLALWPYRPAIYNNRQIQDRLQQQLASGDHQHLQALVINLAQQSQLTIPHIATCLYHLLWHDMLAMDWQQLLFDDAIPHPDATVWLPQTGGAS